MNLTTTHEVEEALSAQADSLLAGQAPALPALAAAQPLLALAGRVHAVLRPVEPRPAFVAALKAQLLSQPAVAAPAPAHPSLWLIVAGVLSLASALVLVIRWLTSGTRLPAAKMRAAP